MAIKPITIWKNPSTITVGMKRTGRILQKSHVFVNLSSSSSLNTTKSPMAVAIFYYGASQASSQIWPHHICEIPTHCKQPAREITQTDLSAGTDNPNPGPLGRVANSRYRERICDHLFCDIFWTELRIQDFLGDLLHCLD